MFTCTYVHFQWKSWSTVCNLRQSKFVTNHQICTQESSATCTKTPRLLPGRQECQSYSLSQQMTHVLMFRGGEWLNPRLTEMPRPRLKIQYFIAKSSKIGDLRKLIKTRLWDSSQMPFWDFKIEWKVSKTCNFLGTVQFATPIFENGKKQTSKNNIWCKDTGTNLVYFPP